ncbi:MAG: hypothetical protein GY737_26175 [Desulfobacteraceae bacterium]|nr:hypothetical protein [Desulfobacteraceae bacterium]
MMEFNCRPIPPDSFTGAVMAVESIRDAAVLLNGPTGCKFYHGSISEFLLPRAEYLDPLYYSEEFYFGQPRVPATYLDDYDYVFGATQKLEKILPVVAEKGHSLIAIVNSPGAALIGDDLERFIKNARLPVPCIAMENTGFSDSFAAGFQDGVIQVIKQVAPPPGTPRKHTVNLLGLSIFHHHWQGNLNEITTLLNACGIEVNTVLCAGTTIPRIENLGSAGCNLVIHREYADQLAHFLEERFQVPTLMPSVGAPIGFEATEAWIDEVCDCLDIDPGPAMAVIKGARRRSHEVLNRFNSLTGLPKGATFAVSADASIALPLVTWLYNYLGMVPVAVKLAETVDDFADELNAFLRKIGCLDAWNADMAGTAPDIVFGSEADISRLRLTGHPFTGIDISLPAASHIHVVEKSFMGAQGTLYLIEKIINGLFRAM